MKLALLFVSILLTSCSRRTLPIDLRISSDALATQDAQDAQDTPGDIEDGAENFEITEIVEDSEDTADGPEDIESDSSAERFASFDDDLCFAWVRALAPEFGLDRCANRAAEDREECSRLRTPVVEYVHRACRLLIEEARYWNMDPALGPSVIDRESGWGKLIWHRPTRTYRVNPDNCVLYLTTNRILDRRPGRKEGLEWMKWSWGESRTNSQQVRVLEETDEGIRINTCAFGEEGLFQTIPSNFARGTVVASTGEILTGSREERRRRIANDIDLNIRVGMQELARHRDMFPEDERPFWWSWIASYNTGKTVRTEHYCDYTRKIMANYLQACTTGYVLRTGEAGLSPVSIGSLWRECDRVREAHEAWEFCEQYRPPDPESFYRVNGSQYHLPQP